MDTFSIKKILKKFKLKDYPSPSWDEILKNHKKDFEIIKKKANGKKILISTSTGGHLCASHFESLLAVALTYYGAKVEILLCDKILPACMMTTSHNVSEDIFANKGPDKMCSSCLDSGKFSFLDLGLKVHYFSEYINLSEKKEIIDFIKTKNFEDLKKLKIDDINVGEHALAGALRYYAVGNLDNEKKREIILKRYFEAGLVTKKIITNFYEKNPDFETTVLNHGIYIPQGIINSVSKKFNKKIVTYALGYRKNTFIFSHDDTYHLTMMYEPTKYWENLNITPKINKKLMDYLDSRSLGSQDWIYYFKKPNYDVKKKLLDYGINLNKPIVGMLTNIIWDANLIYPDNIFSNMMEWIFETIDFFKKNNHIQLVIRTHPAEVNSDRVSKQKVKDEIIEKYGKLPNNIFVIGSEDPLSTYVFAKICDQLIIYATKMGMEFTPKGIHVICAGESYIRNKGITNDPKSKKEYFELLEKIPFKEQVNNLIIERAKRYAYHFFFRRSIAIEALTSSKSNWPPFTIKPNVINILAENKDKSLKQICDSIINDKPFIYTDENYV